MKNNELTVDRTSIMIPNALVSEKIDMHKVSREKKIEVKSRLEKSTSQEMIHSASSTT